MCIFFTQQDLPASQKTEILHEKWQKNDKKRYQKEHPAPQKLKFCMKKNVIFTQKDHLASQKTEVLHEKMKKMAKRGTKKSTQPLKNWSFA